MRSRNSILVAIIVVGVLVAAGVLLAMRKSDNTKNAYSSSNSTSMDMPTDQTKSPTDNTSSNQNTVTIKDFAFNPGNTTVKVGTKVTWTNEDSVSHTVTADNPSSDAPASGNIAKGQSYSFTFTKAGTYAYHCTPHPYMKATVTVTE